VSADICSAKGQKVRSEGRDDAGRMKLNSPFIHEIDHALNFVQMQMLEPVPGSPASQPVQKPKSSKKKAKSTKTTKK
jgi:D-alanyl-D-alanine carboxypeptidase